MLLSNFVTLQGCNCILGNVCNAMNYLHVAITEQDLFFWLSPFEGDRDLPDVFEKLYEEKGKCGWKEFVTKSLSEGHPIMVSINPNVLPYMKVKFGGPSTKHYINIIGIDEEKKQLYVSDCYIPTYIPSKFEGWIDYSKISAMDIGKCWRLKRNAISYFQNCHKWDDINYFTLTSSINRLSTFVSKSGDDFSDSGICKMQKLSNTVRNHIENGNYDGIYTLLPGIRLNIINPLVYLERLLKLNIYEHCVWVEKLNELVYKHWEPLNIRLIKFALAHKKLNADDISLRIDEVVELERLVLSDILEWLLQRTDDGRVGVFDFL